MLPVAAALEIDFLLQEVKMIWFVCKLLAFQRYYTEMSADPFAANILHRFISEDVVSASRNGLRRLSNRMPLRSGRQVAGTNYKSLLPPSSTLNEFPQSVAKYDVVSSHFCSPPYHHTIQHLCDTHDLQRQNRFRQIQYVLMDFALINHVNFSVGF